MGFVERIKTLFLSPHQDDETLFAAFTIQRERPTVLICYDSYVQVRRGHWFANAEARREESRQALKILGAGPPAFLGLSDEDSDEGKLYLALLPYEDVEKVYAPAIEHGGNIHHNLVGKVAQAIFGNKLTQYKTYTHTGKSRGSEVIPEQPEFIQRKLMALACYQSQILIENCREHFMRDIREYVL